MPLRDHFRPPADRRPWERVHVLWPATLIARLDPVLPAGFAAAPRMRFGSGFEVDVGTLDETQQVRGAGVNGSAGGAATATLAAPPATLTADVEFLDATDIEVEIYDEAGGGELVAAVEFVSPRNKDRPESRHDFAAKCTALVRRGVCVALVDAVTARGANLYGDMLDELGTTDPALGAEPPATYAASVRRRAAGRKYKLDAWAHMLEVGRPIPMLPLWLGDDLWVPLDLEASYEDACRLLRLS